MGRRGQKQTADGCQHYQSWVGQWELVPTPLGGYPVPPGTAAGLHCIRSNAVSGLGVELVFLGPSQLLGLEWSCRGAKLCHVQMT